MNSKLNFMSFLKRLWGNLTNTEEVKVSKAGKGGEGDEDCKDGRW